MTEWLKGYLSYSEKGETRQSCRFLPFSLCVGVELRFHPVYSPLVII